MTTPLEALERLDKLADKLGRLAALLAQCEEELAPVEEKYQRFVDEFDTGLWFRHVSEGAKLPSAELRCKLAHQEMSPELLGQRVGLLNARVRLKDQIKIKAQEIDAWRSVLSALKTEALVG